MVLATQDSGALPWHPGSNVIPSIDEILGWAQLSRRLGDDRATDTAALCAAVEELCKRIRELEQRDLVVELEGDLSRTQEELDGAKTRVRELEEGGAGHGGEVVADLREQIAEFIESSRIERLINANLRKAHDAEIQHIFGTVEKHLSAGLRKVRNVAFEVIAGAGGGRTMERRRGRRREPDPKQLMLDSVLPCAHRLPAVRMP